MIYSCTQLTQMIVIASIHQPSTSTFLLFDNILLLSEGKTVYYGSPGDSIRYFESQGFPPSPMMSVSEFMLELTNTDFAHGRDHADSQTLETLVQGWKTSAQQKLLADSISNRSSAVVASSNAPRGYPRNLGMQSLILLHRMALVLSS
jgi:ABC-type multidrug transport system ATPase subunit